MPEHSLYFAMRLIRIVIPTNVGIQNATQIHLRLCWIPAFARMTSYARVRVLIVQISNYILRCAVLTHGNPSTISTS